MINECKDERGTENKFEPFYRFSPFSADSGGISPEDVKAAAKCLTAVGFLAAGYLAGLEVSGIQQGLKPGEATKVVLQKGVRAVEDFFKGKNK